MNSESKGRTILDTEKEIEAEVEASDNSKESKSKRIGKQDKKR